VGPEALLVSAALTGVLRRVSYGWCRSRPHSLYRAAPPDWSPYDGPPAAPQPEPEPGQKPGEEKPKQNADDDDQSPPHEPEPEPGGKGGGRKGKKPDIAWMDYIQKKYSLTDEERLELHDIVRAEGISDDKEKIEREARLIAGKERGGD
jgi:hypothetical protein